VIGHERLNRSVTKCPEPQVRELEPRGGGRWRSAITYNTFERRRRREGAMVTRKDVGDAWTPERESGCGRGERDERACRANPTLPSSIGDDGMWAEVNRWFEPRDEERRRRKQERTLERRKRKKSKRKQKNAEEAKRPRQSPPRGQANFVHEKDESGK